MKKNKKESDQNINDQKQFVWEKVLSFCKGTKDFSQIIANLATVGALVLASVSIFISFNSYRLSQATFKQSDKTLQDQIEVNRPFFTVDSPKPIFNKENKFQFLNFRITNVGKRPATSMGAYYFIMQDPPPYPVLIFQPQTWVNDFPSGQTTYLRNTKAELFDPNGKHSIYLYLQYTDLFTNKKYNQTFYFIHSIYGNGYSEYSDAGTLEKKTIEQIKVGNPSLVLLDNLVKSGADEITISSALKKLGVEVQNVGSP